MITDGGNWILLQQMTILYVYHSPKRHIKLWLTAVQITYLWESLCIQTFIIISNDENDIFQWVSQLRHGDVHRVISIATQPMPIP